MKLTAGAAAYLVVIGLSAGDRAGALPLLNDTLKGPSATAIEWKTYISSPDRFSAWMPTPVRTTEGNLTKHGVTVPYRQYVSDAGDSETYLILAYVFPPEIDLSLAARESMKGSVQAVLAGLQGSTLVSETETIAPGGLPALDAELRVDDTPATIRVIVAGRHRLFALCHIGGDAEGGVPAQREFVQRFAVENDAIDL